jgi:hypothetical protein
VALAVIRGKHLNISVTNNDKEKLNAKHISGQLRMTSNSPAIDVRRDAGGLAPISVLRAPADCPRIEILLDPVHFCSCEPKPHSKALKPMLEFAHASEDPRETPNDG